MNSKSLDSLTPRLPDEKHDDPTGHNLTAPATTPEESPADKRYAIIESLRKNPDEIFARILEELKDIDSMDIDSSQESLLLAEAASAYLATVDVDERDPQLGPEASTILTELFDDTIRNHPFAFRGGWTRRKHVIQPHLATLVPDSEALNALISEDSRLLNNTGFYDAWKEAIIDNRLRQQERELIDPTVVEKLKEADVRHLEINIAPVGVPYCEIDEMIDDLRKYFIFGIGDHTGLKLGHTAMILDDQSGAMTAAVHRMSRDDETVLQEDIKQPLKEFMRRITPGTTKLFESPEVRYGGTPYKYETTSFSGHAISVKVATDEHGVSTYYLICRVVATIVKSIRANVLVALLPLSINLLSIPKQQRK